MPTVYSPVRPDAGGAICASLDAVISLLRRPPWPEGRYRVIEREWPPAFPVPVEREWGIAVKLQDGTVSLVENPPPRSGGRAR